MNVLENLKWRYATKKFDPSRKIEDHSLDVLKESIQLSVSSFGLQLYKVLFIKDKELREELKKFSWQQNQITDASYIVVFCNYIKKSEEHVDEFIALKSYTEQSSIEDLRGYGDFIKTKIKEKSIKEYQHWTALQTYLALSNLLYSCAELKIDACPMEGFIPEKYNDILKLSEQGLSASVIAAIGYRSDKDKTQYYSKTRKPIHKLFEEI
ncbi:NAD(P)H-dependent oxidoreductase [Aquimarina muelleri]|uniref:NAD(P)H-dependent oxidoreductase n=1 Tax=Aquimarina muelleri TaxID=279356 RepID=A0A918JU25_9FLAO|nr:NAD(P)H-dependent oxidoreductase [Aquimarina muelleri]MCX2761196.1 NAD(P)H-dependent oxidoreductase [Aquimarina muelleri]GGX08985.1 NAD(P)H-dependent oxidoreductase [Aquimarina muelleri]